MNACEIVSGLFEIGTEQLHVTNVHTIIIVLSCKVVQRREIKMIEYLFENKSLLPHVLFVFTDIDIDVPEEAYLNILGSFHHQVNEEYFKI